MQWPACFKVGRKKAYSQSTFTVYTLSVMMQEGVCI